MEHAAHIKPSGPASRAHGRADDDRDLPGWESQPLAAHLHGTADRAEAFAAAFASVPWARLAGLWHDLGKYQPEFQRYLRSASGMTAHLETESGATPGRVKHAIAGACHAAANLGGAGRLLAYLIAGHHAGLPDWHPETGGALSRELQAERATLDRSIAGGAPATLLTPPALPKPPLRRREELHLWLRMLYSCLVDADFLDTEAFIDGDRARLRGGHAGLPTLCAAYDRYMAERFATADTRVNQLRREIRLACLARAGETPGLFSLSVPTGGGKTLAGLGFALHHARMHGLKRIIYVIPYTSIIEQTADVFSAVFAGIEPAPVIEHHSNLEPEAETARSRLAAENWEAPVIVTTNVQFLESLYAARSSRCRKLHNIAESVVILDEAQLLPPTQLGPVLDALRQLIDRYRVSLVLSTATQPTLAAPRLDPFGRIRLAGLGNARELAPDPARLHRQLTRVDITLPPLPEQRRPWADIATELAAEERVLCIVNRRAEAAELLRLMPPGTIHLSALMCGAHRARVIAGIKHDLQRETGTTRVVSTQLIEAGVDLDFPVVYRAMAGLDSIAQAAGRCNREGKLYRGRVIVFDPPRPSPDGLLRMAEDAARRTRAAAVASAVPDTDDPLSPAHCRRFFDFFYDHIGNYDENGVMSLLTRDAVDGQIQFRTAAKQFRLIPDRGQRPVFVRWGEGSELLERLKRDGPNRELLRRLQRYAVTLYEFQWRQLLDHGDLEIHQGFLLQRTEALYDPVLGLLPEITPHSPKDLVC